MRLTVCVFILACLAAAGATGQGRMQTFERLYRQHCAVCHGDRFEGTAQGTPIVGAPLIRGEGVEAIAKSIAEGAADLGMPAWAETLSETQIRSLAILIAEERANATFADFRMAPPLELPDGIIGTEHHEYRLTKVIDGLEPLPYSIAPLPDGRILLTEKMRGVTVVARDGTQSELVAGAPVGNREAFRMGPLQYGLGWILDVALHPDFAANGWIYLSFGDRCTDCGVRPESMIKLVRARLKGGAWVDEQTVYQAAREHYNRASDMAAGGRIAFDHAGHVFLSLGMKGGYEGSRISGYRTARYTACTTTAASPKTIRSPQIRASCRASGPTGTAASTASRSICARASYGAPRWDPAAATRSTCSSPARTTAGR